MYNVMIVDDDYPVLEFLSEEIDWELLGLQLQSVHENGVSALEYALTDMPDILVTDIGMPKMNGLELTAKLKKKNPQLQVAILSCHNEFSYAQQAITLNVQDYILKETLDPNDFAKLLATYKERLDKQIANMRKQHQLIREMNKTKAIEKEKFIKQLIYHSDHNQIWYLDDNPLRSKLENRSYLPVLCLVDNYLSTKEYFNSEDTLRFAMENIINDIIKEYYHEILYVNFELNQSFLLIPLDGQQQVKRMIKQIQWALRQYLNISTSYVIGKSAQQDQLSINLKRLTLTTETYFYRQPFSINHQQGKEPIDQAASTIDLFTFYDDAEIEFRNALLANDQDIIKHTVDKWIRFIKNNQFPPKTVKEWILKLLLGLKVKMQSLHLFTSNYQLEILHHEMILIDSIDELNKWLYKSMESAQLLMFQAQLNTKHKEILNACIYISQHLDSKLTLEIVANHVYLNPSYFSRLFKREMGMTFIEYVTSLKMERAKELLDQTPHTVSEIAEKLGYDNQSYFIKLFKNLVGKTPTEYRGHP